MLHYTNKDGYDGIRAAPTWRFRAARPPGDPDAHPFGTYFTTLSEKTSSLAARLRIPRSKLHYAFEFSELDDLRKIPRGRGQYVFYSPSDYRVEPARQRHCGRTSIDQEAP